MKMSFSSSGTLLSFLAFALLFTLYQAQSVTLKRGESCAKVCSGESKIYSFQSDQIYTYEFITRQIVQNPNSDKETVQLVLTGKAEISKQAGCDYGLQLKDVVLKEELKAGGGDAKEFSIMKTILEKQPIRFGLDDGRVTGVCPENNDNEYGVNIKKAIISALQVNLNNLDTPNYITETDVVGDCLTEYSTSAMPPNFVVVTKSKATSGCARKIKYFSTISGKMYEQPIEGRNMPMLDGSYSCTIKIKRGEGLKETICKETQKMRPLSSEISGSSITIELELKYASMRDGQIKVKVPVVRTDLTMNHGDKEPYGMKKKVVSSKEVLTKLCKETDLYTITGRDSELFIELIRAFSSEDYKTISDSHQNYLTTNKECAKNKAKIENMVLDALSNSKSESALKYYIETSKGKSLFGLSLAMIQNPTEKLIEQMTEKMQNSDELQLIVSSMAMAFCEQNEGCMKNPAIVKAINAIISNLGDDCSQNSKKVMYALRSIGNVGRVPSVTKLTKVLTQCTQKKNKELIRVYTVEAVKRFECDADVDKFLESIFSDVKESSELRIHAYLGLMRCPTKAQLDSILNTLTKEDSQQVGTFVWSHMTNLAETNMKYKRKGRDLVRRYALGKLDNLATRFDLDYRSYSRNYERSLARMFSSVDFDANVIFTTQSPLPTSLSLNVSLNVYGRSINFMEMGLRSEGDLYSTLVKTPNKPVKNPVMEDVIRMDDKINKPSSTSSLTFAMYLKVFGKELYFSPNLVASVLGFAINMGNKISIEKGMLLLDGVASVSTVSGMPLETALEVAAVGQAKFDRNTDLQLNNIKLNTRLNSAVRLVGRLSINGHCTKIGVKTEAEVSIDRGMGGSLNFDENNTAKTKNSFFKLYVDEQPSERKLLAVKNMLSLEHSVKKIESMPKMESWVDKCSSKFLNVVLGMKVCVSVKKAVKQFETFLPNIDASIQLKEFKGLKLFWNVTNDVSIPRVPKIIFLHGSIGYNDGSEDLLRVKMMRDPKEVKQTYEILLGQKYIYGKVEIEKTAVSGEYIFGKTQGKITGALTSAGITETALNLKFLGPKEPTEFYFQQKFKFPSGLYLLIKLDKKGENGFSINSKTSLKITDHKVYNTFERYHHSTRIILPGDNKFSIIVEHSKGNKPAIEIKGKLETFWKVKDKNKFLVVNRYSWLRKESAGIAPTMAKGTNYTIETQQQIEVNDKKYNVRYFGYMFVTNDIMSLRLKNNQISVGLKQYDLTTTVPTIQSVFRHDLVVNLDDSREGVSRVLHYVESGKGLKAQTPTKSTFEITWKKRAIEDSYGYDLTADFQIDSLKLIKMSHINSSPKMFKSDFYINILVATVNVTSKLTLPKSHDVKFVLYIAEARKTYNYRILTKIRKFSPQPFIVTLDHTVQIDDKDSYFATNSLDFNRRQGTLAVMSKAQSSDKKLIYQVDMNHVAKMGEISIDRVKFDIQTKVGVNIPAKDINYLYKSSKKANFERSQELLNRDSFVSSSILRNRKTNDVCGSELQIGSRSSMNQISYTIYINSVNNRQRIIIGKSVPKAKDFKMLILVDFEKWLDTRFKFDVVRIGMQKWVTTKVLLKLGKKRYGRNIFYKHNQRTMVKSGVFKQTIKGRFGELEKNSTLFERTINIKYKDWSNVDVYVKCFGPLLRYYSIAKFTTNLNFKLDSWKQNKIALLLKWQRVAERTAKYVEFKSVTKLKQNQLMYDLNIVKDSPKNIILRIKSNYYFKQMRYSVELKFSPADTSINLRYDFFKSKDNKLRSMLKLNTNIDQLKLLKLDINGKWQFKGNKKVFNLPITFEIKSENVKYKIVAMPTFKNKKISFTLNWNIKSMIGKATGKATMIVNYGDGDKFFKFKIKYNAKDVFELFLKKMLKGMIGTLTNNIGKTVKAKFNYGVSKNNFDSNFKLKYEKEYFNIDKFSIKWKFDKSGSHSYKSVVVIKSSLDKAKDIYINDEFSYEMEKLSKTLITKTFIKYKGKTFWELKVDLKKGVINYFSKMYKVFGITGVDKIKFDFMYYYNSKCDFGVEFKSLKEPDNVKLNFQLNHFKKNEQNKFKNVKSVGKAYLYDVLIFEGFDRKVNFRTFIEKSKKKGFVEVAAKVPDLNLDVSKITLKLKDIKKKGKGSYSGILKYKKMVYELKYTKNEYDERLLTLKSTKAKLSPEWPTEIMMHYKFINGELLLKFKMDDQYLSDLKLKAKTVNDLISATGNYKLLLAGEEYVNMNYNFISKKLPSKNPFFSLAAFYNFKPGFDFAHKFDGHIVNRKVNMNIIIVREKSEKLKGGLVGSFDVQLNVDKAKKEQKKFSIKMTSRFERNLPQFIYKDSFKLIGDDDKVMVEGASFVKYISKEELAMDILLKSKSYNPQIYVNIDWPNFQVFGTYNEYNAGLKFTGGEAKTVDANLKLKGSENMTLSTNLIKLVYIMDSKAGFVNKKLFFNMLNYEFTILRYVSFGLKLSFKEPGQRTPLTITMDLIPKEYEKKNLKLVLLIKSEYVDVRQFNGLLLVKNFDKFETMFDVKLNAKLNKKTIYDASLKSDYSSLRKINGKFVLVGKYRVKADLTMDCTEEAEKKMLKYSIKYGTETERNLWYNTFRMSRSTKDLLVMMENNRGDRKMKSILYFSGKQQKLGIVWDKKNGNMWMIERLTSADKSVRTKLSTPLRIFEVKRNKGDVMFSMKKFPNTKIDNLMIKVQYTMKKNPKEIKLAITSNMLDKPIKITLKKMTTSSSWRYRIIVYPIFDIDAKFKKVSPNTFESDVKLTASKKTLRFAANAYLSLSEVKVDLNIFQTKMKKRQWKLQFIPREKFLLTNNEAFKILYTVTRTQLGYRCSHIMKLDDVGANIEHTVTYSRRPLKYYSQWKIGSTRLIQRLRRMGGSILGELFTEVDGKLTKDASLVIKKNTNNVVTINLMKMSPSLRDKYKKVFMQFFEPARISKFTENFFSDVSARLNAIKSPISLTLYRQLKLSNMLKLVTNLANDMDNIRNKIFTTYNTDLKFVKTFMDKMKKKVSESKVSFGESLSSLLESAQGKASDIYAYFSKAELYSAMYDSITKMANKMYKKVSSKVSMEKFEMKLNKILTKWKAFIKDISSFLGTIGEYANSVFDIYKTNYDDAVANFKKSKFYEKLMLLKDVRDQFLEGLNSVVDTKLIKERLSYVEDAINRLKEYKETLKKMRSELKTYITSSSPVRALMDTIDLIRSRKFKEAFLDVIRPEKASIKYYKDQKLLTIKFYASPLLRPMMKIGKVLMFSVPARSLLRIQGSYRTAQWLKSYFYKYEFLVFQLNSWEYVRNMLPPFPRTAYVINKNAIVTFDGNYIKMGDMNDCAYLLVRDTKFKSFAVTMDNKKFTVHHKEEISVDWETAEVKQKDNVLKTLPIVYRSYANLRNMWIHRNEDSVSIETANGLLVRYHFDMKVLEIRLDGTWHGRVRGLLGTNDFDAINDWSEPAGNILYDAGVLTDSWRLPSTSSCKSSTKRGLYQIRVDLELLDRCTALFDINDQSKSYLSRCFSMVDPKPYLLLCTKSLQYSYKKKDFEKLLCQLSRNYVNQCTDRGMQIRLDKSCVTCGEKRMNSLISVAWKLKKTNFIFVLERSNCAKAYANVINKLGQSLAVDKNNRFTVLEMMKTRTDQRILLNTVNKKNTLLDINGFKQVINEFWDESYLKMFDNKINQSTVASEGMYKALKLRGEYGYKEKIIIVSCIKCLNHQKYIYSLLASMLEKSQISITYLTDQAFAGPMYDENVVGISATKDYVFKASAGYQVQSKPRSKMIYPPNDNCASLALLQNGSIWALKNMKTEQQIRRATDAISSYLLSAENDKMKRPVKQKCVCLANKYDLGRVKCEFS